jgi:LysM repeat protein
MRRKFIPILLILVLISAGFLTGCKKAAPDVDLSVLQPEDEVVIMQEEAVDNIDEATAEPAPTESAEATPEDTGESGQEAEGGQGGESGETEAETVEPTPEPTPEPVETPQPVTLTPGKHVVRAGETLYRIAVTYGTTVDALAQANSITNPSLIYPGQEIVIPSGTSGTSPGTAEPLPGGTVYIVKPGDNLFRIALRYGLDQYYLARYNGIQNMSLISVGQEIRIP